MGSLIEALVRCIVSDGNDHRLVRFLLVLLIVMVLLVGSGIGILWYMSHQAARLGKTQPQLSQAATLLPQRENDPCHYQEAELVRTIEVIHLDALVS